MEEEDDDVIQFSFVERDDLIGLVAIFEVIMR